MIVKKKKITLFVCIFFIYTLNYSFELINEISLHTSSISCIIFSKDNKNIISGGYDNMINIIGFENFKYVRSLNNINPVESIDISNDNKFILSGDIINGVRLWDLKSLKLIKYFESKFERIFTVKFSKDNSAILFGGINGYEIINLKTFKIIKSKKIKNFAVRDACFSENGKYLFITVGNKVEIFNIKKNNIINKFLMNHENIFEKTNELEYQDLIYTIDISEDSQYLVSAGNNSYVSLIRIEDLSHLWSLKPHTELIWNVKFSSNSKLLATASKDKKVSIIDIENKKLLFYLVHPDEIFSIDFSSDGKYLITACRDGKIRIFKSPYVKNFIDFKYLYILTIIIFSIIILFIIKFKIQKLKQRNLFYKY